MSFNVNTDASIRLTERLENLTRSAFPIAVRGTLNDAAFDVKKNTLQESASSNFIRRSPNFFRTFSAVNRATGFDVNAMSSEVGMSDNGKLTAHTAVAHMEQQEVGGKISGGLDYLKAARTGNSTDKRVRRANYYDRNKVISGRARGRNRGTKSSNFVARVFRAYKENKPMFFNSLRGNYLMKVNSITKKNGKIKIRSTLLIKDRSGDPVTIKATHFSREAAERTVIKMPSFYAKQAQRQFDKALR